MPLAERERGATAVALPAPGSPPAADSGVARELARGMAELCREHRIPGVSLALVHHGRATRRYCYGLADPRAGRPVDAHTVWPYFSVTKLFTAVAVLQLVAAGRLALEDDVRQHLPWLQPRRAGRAPVHLSLAHLLSHRSGYTRTRDSLGFHFIDERGPGLGELARHLAGRPLAYAPGTRSSYSNTNYLLLGAVIESCTRQPFEERLRSSVLAPLGLASAGFRYTSGSLAGAAIGCVPTWSLATLMLPFIVPLERLGRLLEPGTAGQRQLAPFYIDGAPFGGLLGNVDDLATFLRFHLDAHDRRFEAVLPWRYRQLMHGHDGGEFGLGWQVAGVGAGLRLTHTGGGPGFKTWVYLAPAQGFGAVVLMNAFVVAAVEHEFVRLARRLGL